MQSLKETWKRGRGSHYGRPIRSNLKNSAVPARQRPSGKMFAEMLLTHAFSRLQALFDPTTKGFAQDGNDRREVEVLFERAARDPGQWVEKSGYLQRVHVNIDDIHRGDLPAGEKSTSSGRNSAAWRACVRPQPVVSKLLHIPLDIVYFQYISTQGRYALVDNSFRPLWVVKSPLIHAKFGNNRHIMGVCLW